MSAGAHGRGVSRRSLARWARVIGTCRSGCGTCLAIAAVMPVLFAVVFVGSGGLCSVRWRQGAALEGAVAFSDRDVFRLRRALAGQLRWPRSCAAPAT